MWTKFQQWLFIPINISSIAFFRIAFGVLMLLEVFKYIYKGWVSKYWIDVNYVFPYEGFEWISPWGGNGMYIHFLVLGILAVFITLGFLYRISMSLFFLGFTYVFLLDKSMYLNHFYLISLLSFIMIFIPAHRNYSLDALVFPKTKQDFVSNWTLRILQFQIAIVYIYGGISKLNFDWLSGEPMRIWLANAMDFPFIGQYFQDYWTPYLFSYGGLCLDLFIIPLLLWKKTRTMSVVILTSFHLMNARLFQIGIFPWFMIAATTLFFKADWAKRFLDKFSIPQEPKFIQLPFVSPPLRRIIMACILIFVSWQMLMPLRHYFVAGNTHWTEEGRKWSWHMKSRNKSGKAIFYVQNLDTGEEWEEKITKHISRRQYKRMMGNPDMIFQFAHVLKEKAYKKGHRHVAVRVVANISLNGRKRQLIIDPEANLVATEKYPMPAPWILSLDKPLPSPNRYVVGY